MRVIRAWVLVGVFVASSSGVAEAQGLSPRLQKQLEEEARRAEEEQRKAEAEAARKVPQQAYPGLTSEDAAVRRQEVTRLGRIRDPAAGAALLAVLVEDPDAEVRARAAWALGRLEQAEAIPQLAAALQGDSSRRVRRSAALALGEIGGKDARDALVVHLQHDDEQVAAAAIEALGRTGAPDVRERLREAARDPRALVSLTAKRTLATLPRPATVPTTPVVDSRACNPAPDALLWARGPDCAWRRDVSDEANGDPFFVLTGAALGAVGGVFSIDAIRPTRTGVRVTPKRTPPADNSAAPLERAILGGLGAGLGAGSALAWTLIDDVTLSRAGLIALLAAEGIGVGAGLALSTSMSRQVAVSTMLMTGTFAAVSGTLVTWLPHDFSYGDVAWVWSSAAIGAGIGALTMLTVIPSRVGRQRGREGYIADVADLFPGLGVSSLLPLPWGEVGRFQLALGAGLLTSGVTMLLAASTIPFYEVGITRALATLGAAMFGAMSLGVLVAAPPALFLGDPPGGLPTPERIGTGVGLLGGAALGALVFALWPNDPGQGPLIVFERPRRSRPGRGPVAPVVLQAPTVSVVPPLPALGNDGRSGGGVYVGLVNARY